MPRLAQNKLTLFNFSCAILLIMMIGLTILAMDGLITAYAIHKYDPSKVDPVSIRQVGFPTDVIEDNIFKDLVPNVPYTDTEWPKNKNFEDLPVSEPVPDIFKPKEVKPEPLKWWERFTNLFKKPKPEIPKNPYVFDSLEIVTIGKIKPVDDGVIRIKPTTSGWYPIEAAHLEGEAIEWTRKAGHKYQGFILSGSTVNKTSYIAFIEQINPKGTTIKPVPPKIALEPVPSTSTKSFNNPDYIYMGPFKGYNLSDKYEYIIMRPPGSAGTIPVKPSSSHNPSDYSDYILMKPEKSHSTLDSLLTKCKSILSKTKHPTTEALNPTQGPLTETPVEKTYQEKIKELFELKCARTKARLSPEAYQEHLKELEHEQQLYAELEKDIERINLPKVEEETSSEDKKKLKASIKLEKEEQLKREKRLLRKDLAYQKDMLAKCEKQKEQLKALYKTQYDPETLERIDDWINNLDKKIRSYEKNLTEIKNPRKPPLTKVSVEVHSRETPIKSCKKNLTGIKNPRKVPGTSTEIPGREITPPTSCPLPKPIVAHVVAAPSRVPNFPILRIAVPTPEEVKISARAWEKALNTKPDPKINYEPVPEIIETLKAKLHHKLLRYPIIDEHLKKFTTPELRELCKLPLSLEHPNYFKVSPFQDINILRSRNILVLAPSCVARHNPVHDLIFVEKAASKETQTLSTLIDINTQTEILTGDTIIQTENNIVDASTQVFSGPGETCWRRSLDLTKFEETKLIEYTAAPKTAILTRGVEGGP